jgi:site-specific DNA recombinase
LGGNAAALTITREFLMQIRRRGFETRLVIQGSHAPASMVDLALLKIVSRGYQWSNDLVTARTRSIAEIAARESVSPRYVRRLLKVAFLAPGMVEAIVEGRQPPELTAEALAERIELPLLWTEQERTDGISQFV